MESKKLQVNSLSDPILQKPESSNASSFSLNLYAYKIVFLQTLFKYIVQYFIGEFVMYEV